MALGNNISMGQGRGKNKATLVKRYKEVNAAKGFYTIQGSALQGSAACPVSNANVNITYYHNGTAAIPSVGDKIYTRKRASDKFIITNADEHLKVGPERGRYFTVNYKNGAIASITACP